jgi:hypothetical protein
MQISMMRCQLAFAIFFSIFPVLVASGATLPTEEEVKGLQTLCGAGNIDSVTFKTKVDAAIKSWRELSANADVGVAKSNLTGVLGSLDKDAEVQPLYKLYLDCVKDSLQQFLAQHANSSFPIPFPRDVLSGNMFVTKIKITRGTDTVVRIPSASCNLYIWLSQWVIDNKAPGRPALNFAMTPSGKYVTEYSFEVRYTRDGRAVDDAGWATRDDETNYDKEQKRQFLLAALSNPDEIHAYLAIRAASDDCVGYYKVTYQTPRSARQ